MSAPDKPWEASSRFQNMDRNRSSELPGFKGNCLNGNSPQIVNQPRGTVRNGVLPPLPPRPPQLSHSVPNRPMYGVPSSMYGGNPGYSGYGGFSSYGNYPGSMYGGYSGGYGYGSFGYPNNAFENRFLQAAEESSRGTLQSIESLVRAFTSVSMMLESTYYAMHTTFRAILGVVDNFSRLRQMFVQFLSAITFLRIIQNFYRRLLYWLGRIDHDPRSDEVWNSVSTGAVVSSSANSSPWPLLTFFGVLLGGPYLVSKLISTKAIEPKKWELENGKSFKSAYSYQATSEAELSFRENEIINVAPAELQLQNGGGWVLACNMEGKVGYIPVTRLLSSAAHRNVTNTSRNVINSDQPQG